jgi:hypothetical protein
VGTEPRYYGIEGHRWPSINQGEVAAVGRLHHYDTRTQLVLILDGRVPKPDRWIDTRQYTQRCLSEN